jgi:hypothetical protein
MARIRTIKPEFPQSEPIGKLSRGARLLFIQLWTLVDDEGRARAAPRLLASLLYPYDDDAPSLIDGWLDELERNACIRRYEADGSRYLDIPNWLKHQKIDRPTASRLPAFRDPVPMDRECSPRPREALRELAADLGSGSGPGSGSGSGAGPKDQVSSSLRSDARASEGKPAKARATRLELAWMPSPDGREAAKREGLTDADIRREAAKFRDYWIAKPGAGGLKLDWPATWRNWCRRACEQLGRSPAIAPAANAAGRFYAAAETPQLTVWDAWSRQTKGRRVPRDRNGGRLVASEWPPGSNSATGPPAARKQAA